MALVLPKGVNVNTAGRKPPEVTIPRSPIDTQGQVAVPDPVTNFGACLRQKYGGLITGELRTPLESGRYADLPETLSPQLVAGLRARGIERLYSHQREAWDLTQSGSNLVVVTPTASGKSLCFNLPVLDAVVKHKAKALYLFPTKALSQDQVAEVVAIDQAGELGVKAFTFDGDTPGDARKAVRTRGDIVVSNPDMLHQAILPHHTKWAQFFESLAFIVVDELHSYRGVFGSHVANVFRRLARICQFYGVKPIYIACSATIANPGELATRLIGQPVAAITKSGAPRGAKTVLLWNPPVRNRELGIRASARSQTALIARMAVKADLKSIVFAQTRIMVEVLTKYLKDTFDNDPRKPSRVRAYRGGYLPTERRATEKQLREGRCGLRYFHLSPRTGSRYWCIGCLPTERLPGNHCRFLAKIGACRAA